LADEIVIVSAARRRGLNGAFATTPACSAAAIEAALARAEVDAGDVDEVSSARSSPRQGQNPARQRRSRRAFRRTRRLSG
jgi:hypothetical protein